MQQIALVGFSFKAQRSPAPRGARRGLPLPPHSADAEVPEEVRPLAEGGEEEGEQEQEAPEVEHNFRGVFDEGFSNHSVDYDARSRTNIKKKVKLFS